MSVSDIEEEMREISEIEPVSYTHLKVPDLVFGQLNEQFIRDYQDFILLEKGYAVDTLRGYLEMCIRDRAPASRLEVTFTFASCLPKRGS